jgi:WD40 repeat protein
MTDSTVVSGDSRGQVQLWDGATGVLMDTFRQHSADVLALVVSPGEKDIFASGVDGKVVCLQRSQCAEGSGLSAASSTWIYVHAHRAHSHDVFSLAVVPVKVKRVGSGSDDELVLLSGGVEGRLSTYAVDSFVRVRPTWIPAIPTQSLTSCSHSREVIAVRHSDHVDVWQLQYLKTTAAAADPPSSSDAVLRPQLGVVATNPNCQLHSRLILKGDHHIHCCGLSPSGDVVALSSASGLRMYQLASMGGIGDDDAAREKKFLVPSIINAPGEFVQAIAFVDRWVTSQPQHAQDSSSKKKRRVVSAVTAATTLVAVYCAKKGCIFVCELSPPPPPTPDDDDNPAVGASGGRLLCSIRSELPHILSSSSSIPIAGWDPLDRAVRKMVFSGPGSDYLAVLSCGSISRVFVYSVGNNNKQQQQLHWILPTDTQLVTDMAFLCRSSTVETHGHQDLEQQSDPTSLVCVNASNCFHVFDIDQLKLGPEYIVPRSIRDMPGPICGVSVLDNQMIMFGQGYCVFVDLSLSLLPPSAGEGASPDRDSLVRLAPGDASSKLLQSSSSAYASKQTKRQQQRRDDPAVEEEHGEGGQGDERSGREGEGGFVVFNKYRNLLQVTFKSSNELVRVY